MENFYGNSVYTAKGKFSILTGVFPSIHKNIFVYHSDLRTQTLPEILQNNGYRTSYFQIYRNMEFANTRQYISTMNFDIMKAIDEEFITASDMKHVWGWGLQDDFSYKKHFEYLDKDYQQNIDKKGHAQPYFSVFMTASHHYNFQEYPPDQAYIYPNPQSYTEHFANSTYLQDKYLETFFAELQKRDYLQNSIVIITGDHGFPATGVKESGFVYDGYTEDRFKTPFLMIDMTETLKPERIKKAHSQLDIAPTVMDLLNLKDQNHFQGTSILSDSDEQHAVPLVQPYEGVYIATVIHPYKYVRNERTGAEHLFHLKNDPDEQHNLIDSKEKKIVDILARLKKDHEKAYLNQRLIEENRLWPPESP